MVIATRAASSTSALDAVGSALRAWANRASVASNSAIAGSMLPAGYFMFMASGFLFLFLFL